MKEAASKANDVPVHGVLCVPREFLEDDDFLNDALVAQLPETKVAGVWVWFSRLDERTASKRQLTNLMKLTSSLGSKMKVFNLHGGFFSLALSKHGLTGIAHGVGYGEQKDVVPVIGQSTPSVRYYLPALFARFGVPDIERGFNTIGVNTPSEFFSRICDCVVCRGVIASSLSNFREFGERHFSTPDSKRAAQTPAAAKRCRFHFLLCRLKERDWIGTKTNDEVVKKLRDNCKTWKPTVLSDHVQQVELWASILEKG